MNEAYEMMLHRDSNLEGVCSLSCNFSDIKEWHTKDLFQPHSSKPNLWQFHSQTDNIIMLFNEKKFNHVLSEAIIANHSLLFSILIVEQARFQAAFLVKLKAEVQTDSLIEDL